MLDKLQELSRRHQELAEQLADPVVLKNKNKYITLNREYSELSGVVELYNQLKKKLNELAGARELAGTESDPDLQRMAENEIEELKREIADLKAGIKQVLDPPDPFDAKNAILEIRAGTGGAEAGLFAADLFRMYSRYAETQGWKVEILSRSLGELDGLKEVIALISGRQVYGKLRYESGVHRVQRIPVTEAGGRIHTSAVTVAVLPEAEDVEIEIDPADIRIDVYRSSGPGGQSVNTTDSAVRITHLETGLVVTCQDEKSQHKNKSKALKILKSRLLDRALQKQQEKIAMERRQMVSTGDRSAKIRTYNYPQNRVSDHRINLTLHKLNQILEGNLDEFISALQTHCAAAKISMKSKNSSNHVP
ncbi:peptide chain release factor 1 [bacterium]|nr:peptide chain release factor 1 [candidate division CSSED10-310 bacterium]